MKNESDEVEKKKRNKRKQERMRLKRNEEFNKTRRFVGDRVGMCRMKRLGRNQRFESARAFIGGIVKEKYEQRAVARQEEAEENIWETEQGWKRMVRESIQSGRPF